MFLLFDKEKQRVPIKVWLGHKSQLEDSCLQQAMNLANHPTVFKHVSLMSDTHMGYGMPIGGVIACENAIIPNAVGVDIGCGVRFCLTDIDWNEVKDCKTRDGQEIRKAILGNIMRNIPVGFKKHKEPQEWTGFDTAPYFPIINEHLDNARLQLGTLGTGNHFCELQVDKHGKLAIMIHSGSRNLGKQICDYYNKVAKKLNKTWHSNVDPSWDLAFLPLNTTTVGQEYLQCMNFALRFAHRNRELMMERAKSVVFNMLKKYGSIGNIKVTQEIDIHHNYAAIENHSGKNVIVHRKGATRAVINSLGIIPGSMGTSSYIVRGRNNSDSFHSCSHGAGRALSRKKALAKYSPEHVAKTMKELDIVVVSPDKSQLPSECKEAYKAIEEVIKNQKDLIEIENRLTPIGVLKA